VARRRRRGEVDRVLTLAGADDVISVPIGHLSTSLPRVSIRTRFETCGACCGRWRRSTPCCCPPTSSPRSSEPATGPS
jgi:hypothetical protein